MNWKKGFKRLTWAASLSLFTLVSILVSVVVWEDNNQIPLVFGFYEELINSILEGIFIGACFFLGIWILYFILKWIALGFSENKENEK